MTSTTTTSDPTPESLIDKIESSSTTTTTTYNNPTTHKPISLSPTPTPTPTTPTFNPIEFLNSHYQTESTLITALPTLRTTLRTRIQTLDTSISTTIQKQADLADLTLSDVSRAKSAIVELHSRVTTVQSKARLSERAVQEITRDMKRLDYAKKHLSRTITALKRLHMLVHASEQLRVCVERRPWPEYRGAANLMDATRLLLGHFEGYMKSVGKMRDLKEDVEGMRRDLEGGIVFGFRQVGFGLNVAMELEEKEGKKEGEGKGRGKSRTSRKDGSNNNTKTPPIRRSAAYDNDATATTQPNPTSPSPPSPSKPPMPPAILSAACHALDSISPTTRSAFIRTFTRDHLRPYNALFDPKNNTSSSPPPPPESGGGGGGGGGGGPSLAASKSFKIRLPEALTDKSGGVVTARSSSVPLSKSENQLLRDADRVGDALAADKSNPNPASLDQVERRYAWYRRMVKDQLEDNFPGVFPRSWNMHYHMTLAFLTVTGEHFLVLLSNTLDGVGGEEGAAAAAAGGTGGADAKEQTKKEKKDFKKNPFQDRDYTNVTVLLKALQKTMLFEKEMTAWLQREHRAVFTDPNNSSTTTTTTDNGGDTHKHHQRRPPADEEERLEFDEAGRSAIANSAEGIRIKYERQMKERQKKEALSEQRRSAAAAVSSGGGGNTDPTDADTLGLLEDIDTRTRNEASTTPIPVPPLIGVASTSFDRFMTPYIRLEEQNMDEMLVQSASDKTVDNRGELPVFTSSTALFVYIKNSITRCTVLTRGKTLFLLYQAFQDTLRKYAQVLEGKFPSPLSAAAAAITNLSISLPATLPGSSSSSSDPNAVYRIPSGEETTICHVIDTCEYCADTVEALQDLISDKIEESYRPRIDMGRQQDGFHDVTARGIRVLVSGLAQRTEAAFKAMSAIAWANVDVVGEESGYVRSMHAAIQPFVVNVKELLPNSYFRNFCDKFAVAFTTSFYNGIVRCKRISEAGTQQFLLDVYNLKTLLLKMPVLDTHARGKLSPTSTTNPSTTTTTTTGVGGKGGSTIAPAMYTKMVAKEFHRIETLLKLVGTPTDLLIDVFRVQWSNGSALNLQLIMNLKGMKRNEQAAMLEKFGVDPVTAMKGAAAGATTGLTVTENIQALRDGGSDVAAKVNSDLNTMREKVENFRRTFR